MTTLLEAIRDRAERAITVRAEYRISRLSRLMWRVTHPDEPGRSYLVDPTEGTCDCADADTHARRLKIECKHVLAVRELLREERKPSPPSVVGDAVGPNDTIETIES